MGPFLFLFASVFHVRPGALSKLEIRTDQAETCIFQYPVIGSFILANVPECVDNRNIAGEISNCSRSG